MKTYKDLDAWQTGVDFCSRVYKTTASFPASERSGLAQQVRRCALSVALTIAEGWGKNDRGEFIRLLQDTRHSFMELDSLLIICEKLGYLDQKQLRALAERMNTFDAAIQKLISKLKKKWYVE